jgi:protease-4
MPAGQPTGPGTSGGTGWYSGPLPIGGLTARESTGAAIGRTAIKAITALVVFGVGLFVIPFLFVAALAGLGAAIGGSAAETDASATPRTLVAGERDADLNLVAVPLTGLILGEDRNGAGGGLFAPLDLTFGYTVKEELLALAEDDSVDGVILEVDSPGGTIFGSKAVADGIEEYRAISGKPIVAYVSGISASGGVYAMAGADTIYADHGTLIGSIGVIFGPFTTYDGVTAIDGGILGGGVTTEGGIDVEYLTAGRSKDFGNPYRPMTEEERRVLQVGLDDAYAEFVGHVSKGRDIPASTIENELGALIFGETQAVENGLIDVIANRDETYRLAAEEAGLADGETWKVERLDPTGSGFFSLFAGPVGGPDAAEQRAERQARWNDAVRPLCVGSAGMLAYHGDPGVLCR